MQMNSINNCQSKQSFGVRYVSLDQSLMAFSEKVLSPIEQSLPELYKIGDHDTDIFIKAMQKPSSSLGIDTDNNAQLAIIGVKGGMTASAAVNMPSTITSKSQILQLVSQISDALKKASDSPAAKLFQRAVNFTEEHNIPESAYAHDAKIGFVQPHA